MAEFKVPLKNFEDNEKNRFEENDNMMKNASFDKLKLGGGRKLTCYACGQTNHKSNDCELKART